MEIEMNKCVLLSGSPISAMPAIMKKTVESIAIGQLFSDLEKEIGSPVDLELPESFNKSKPTTYFYVRRKKSQPAVLQEKITESPPAPVLRSSSKGNDSCRKRARTEKCSNDDDDEVVRTVEWVHNAEKIVGDMRKDDDGRDGDCMFKPRKETLEKFKHTLCDADQLALADVPLVKLQDAVAHHSLANNAINHQLLLRVAHLENELKTCKSKLVSETNKKTKERTRTRSLQKLEELEKSLVDSYSKNVELKLRLDELNSGLKKAREEGLKAFMKSKTYETLVTKRAALHEYQGFSKCLHQAIKLAAFRKDFNMSLLDPFKNEKSGKDPIIIEDEVDDAESEEDEFAFLLKHLDRGD